MSSNDVINEMKTINYDSFNSRHNYSNICLILTEKETRRRVHLILIIALGTLNAYFDIDV